MLRRVMLALSLVGSLALASPVQADPITYDFAGTLQQAVDGSKAFSGSFTINATPSTAPDQADINYLWGNVNEYGSNVSITVQIGGQTLNFTNTPANPYLVELYVNGQDGPYSTPNGTPIPEISFGIEAGADRISTDPNNSFGLQLFDYGVDRVPQNLSSLSLPIGTSSVGLSVNGGNLSFGSLTSLTLAPVPAPEPSALAVYAGLGLILLIRNRAACRRG